MFNIFRSAVTGYKVKNSSVNGLEIKTFYKGKRPASDPFATLKELKMKLNENPVASSVILDLSFFWEDRLGYLKGVYPSSTVNFKIKDQKYNISRFVTKQGKSPLSLYTFSKNEKIFALFSRVYDYGALYREFEDEMITNYNFNKADLGTNLRYINNDGYSAVLDIFGHSQSFFWNDQEEMEKCLELIV